MNFSAFLGTATLPTVVRALAISLPIASRDSFFKLPVGVLVLVEMFKAHLVMIQRKSANPYARETETGPRPGGAVKAPASHT